MCWYGFLGNEMSIKKTINSICGLVVIAVILCSCKNSASVDSEDTLSASENSTESESEKYVETKNEVLTTEEMTMYAIDPTGPIEASGFMIRYNGKKYYADSTPGAAWFTKQPEMDGAKEIGKIIVVDSRPQNDCEGIGFDDGDIMYYDEKKDSIIVHRVWITDYPWMILGIVIDDK